MVELNVYKNNDANSQNYGKCYARVDYKEEYDIIKLADHMAHHNTPFSKGTIQGILTDMVSCIRELTLMGNTVKIANLAIFKASVQANPCSRYGVMRAAIGAIDDRDFTKASGNTPGLVSLLHGSDVATETTGGTLYYKLTYGSAAGHEDIFGWYWGAANGAAFESPAHKVWLALPAAEARSFIGLPDFDEQTGITTTNYTNDTNSAGAWYTLDGRKLDGTPMKSGIYVNNGKKVIIK